MIGSPLHRMSSADVATLELRVTAYVERNPGLGAREIGLAVMRVNCESEAPGRSRIARALKRLEARGVLRAEGDGRSGSNPRRWFVLEPVNACADMAKHADEIRSWSDGGAT